MITEIIGRNVPEAYAEGVWMMGICGVEEDSRNGPVITIPNPVMLTIKYPWERVLFDPDRDANPFFHVMEFVWMMAGSNDAKWISQFNKRMMEYSDDGILRGAYGWRWNHGNQIKNAIRLLRDDPDTRQCVLQMWDRTYDGAEAKSSDRPCNTHIYLRISADNKLEMTVCNRSNDYFWGMMGSNVVHFTMLQELIAAAVGVEMGAYYVFTNNLHVYTDMPGFDAKWKYRTVHDWYKYDEVSHQPLLEEDEDWQDFMSDAVTMVEGGLDFGWRTEWFRNVASPMHDAYLEKFHRDEMIQKITAPDWKLACSDWNTRRKS